MNQEQVQEEACFVIQRVFRRFINIRIYRYYRDLVNFRHRGDPGLLLRCINPQEAALVQDRASGAVVRFRLGGTVFPPVVYYKVFLRNAVTDIGSLPPVVTDVRKALPGPYTAHVVQVFRATRHNDGECRDDFRASNVKEVTMEVDRSLWYHRYENNGWRPIANKHLHNRDLVAISTAERRMPNFHHKARARLTQQLMKREQKRESWMQRMYRLDFDEYFADWISLATSMTTFQLHATQ